MRYDCILRVPTRLRKSGDRKKARHACYHCGTLTVPTRLRKSARMCGGTAGEESVACTWRMLAIFSSW